MANPFRVIIVGGGIAGLTLANTLQHAGVDFFVLEAHDDIIPQIGAAFAVLPSGARILDQMGMFDDVLALAEPVTSDGARDGSGELMHPRGNTISLIKTRTGYGSTIIDRHEMLAILYKNITDKQKVFTKKRVMAVEHSEKGVSVQCADGSSYGGDIVIGADGVWSKTKKEMWRLANQAHPGTVSAEEMNRLSTEYRGLFAVTDPVPGLDPGDYDVTFDQGTSSIAIVGQNGKIWFALYEHMGRRYKKNELPKFDQDDAEKYATKYADMQIRPNIKISDLWRRKRWGFLAPVEEADFKFWTWGRLACMGDCVHKVTPNAGQGGNMAMEDAAVLANHIKALVDHSPGTRPSQTQIEACLLEYQSDQQDRVSVIVKASNQVSRLHALRGTFEKFFARHQMHIGDPGANGLCDLTVGAPKLEFLPIPIRSIRGVTMPFNPEQGLPKRESPLKRALPALLFFVLSYLATSVIARPAMITVIDAILSLKNIPSHISTITISLTGSGNIRLNDKPHPFLVFFPQLISVRDAASQWQMFSLLTDFGLFIAIVLIEATRRSNVLTLLQLPSLLCLLVQTCGIGIMVPHYFYFHYINSPIEVFKATDMRMTKWWCTAAVLPVVISCYYIPVAFIYFNNDLQAMQSWNWLWQVFPVLFTVTPNLLFWLLPDTTKEDKIIAPKGDLWIIRHTVGICTLASSMTWLWMNITAPVSILEIMVPSSFTREIDHSTWARNYSQLDALFFYLSSLLWLGLLFWDMKCARMVKQSWFDIVIYAGVSILALGPGATIGLGWLWREDVITNKRHWAAITEESLELEKRGERVVAEKAKL